MNPAHFMSSSLQNSYSSPTGVPFCNNVSPGSTSSISLFAQQEWRPPPPSTLQFPVGHANMAQGIYDMPTQGDRDGYAAQMKIVQNQSSLSYKKIARKENLEQHLGSHNGEKSYQCNQCGKIFALECNMLKHQKTHSEPMAYKCNKCDKYFTLKSTLEEHQKTHNGKKAYQCNQCNKCFTQRNTLENHQKIHTGEKPYKCNLCDKSFIQKNNMKVHQATHSGEKPYKCKQCDACFTQKNSMMMHQAIHTGEKPYQCIECGKSFKWKSVLVKHKKIHSAKKPYQCKLCDKWFGRKDHLTVHLKKHLDGSLEKKLSVNKKKSKPANIRSHRVGLRRRKISEKGFPETKLSGKGSPENVEDDKFKDKVPEEGCNNILEACNKAIKLLNANQFEHNKKEIEQSCNLIISKMYQAAGGSQEGMPSGLPGAGDPSGAGSGGSEPAIEVVD